MKVEEQKSKIGTIKSLNKDARKLYGKDLKFLSRINVLELTLVIML